MPLSSEDFEDAARSAAGIELELHLPHGFIIDLMRETDWGFVIKLNAVFESLLNMSITCLLRAVHENGLKEVIVRLDMADFRRGKLAIAARLNLIGPEDRRFLEALAELRNSLAHTVENLNFDFIAWVALMDDRRRNEWAKRFTSSVFNIGQPVTFADNPKDFVFCGAVNVMEKIECSLPPAFIQDIRREATIDWKDLLPPDQSSEEAD